MDFHTLTELSKQRRRQIARDARGLAMKDDGTMSPWLADVLTRAHAPAWRRRFGVEFCALLQDLPVSPATIAGAAWSALRSRVPARN